MRLDQKLVALDLVTTRNKGIQKIKNGKVKVNGKFIYKNGYEVNDNDVIEVIKDEFEFVSRGGYKLLKAIEYFKLDFDNKVVLDIGASSGGFTDCSLKFNSKKVYALDVGSLQLDKSLLTNPKVISLENMNFKDVDVSKFKDTNIIVIDVSFISLTKLIDNLAKLMDEKMILVCLIKPQFECKNMNISKNGLVRDKNVHLTILNDVKEAFESQGIFLNGLTYSPLKGEKSGNIEYLGLFSKENKNQLIDFKEVVNSAYTNLK